MILALDQVIPQVRPNPRWKADFCREFSHVSVKEAKNGAAYKRQRENESVEDYSAHMLVSLAEEGYSPEKQIELYVANMRPEISDQVAPERPKTLDDARTFARRAETVDTCIDKKLGSAIQVNAVSQSDIAKQKLIEIGFDPSTIYIAEKRDSRSRSKSRGRSGERKHRNFSRRKQSHSPRRNTSRRSSSRESNRSSSNRSERSSSRGSYKSSNSSDRSSSKEAHKSSYRRTKGRSATPYRQSKN